jgi:hypothetical protein
VAGEVDDAAMMEPDERGGEELSWQLTGQELCLGKEKAGTSKVFGKFLIIE